jgi:hypothetical protein
MQGDIKDYVIALVNGAYIIGLPANDDAVEPGYQLIRSPDPRGLNQAILPLCFLHEWTRITIPPHSPTIAVSKLSRPEQANLKTGIERCEEMIQKMRLEASGIALPNGPIAIK